MFFVFVGIGVACLPVVLILAVLAKWWKAKRKTNAQVKAWRQACLEGQAYQDDKSKDPGFGTDFQALSLGKERKPDGTIPMDIKNDWAPGGSAVREGSVGGDLDVPVAVPDHIMEAVREVLGKSSVEELTEEYLKLSLQDLEAHVLAATNAWMAAAGTLLTDKLMKPLWDKHRKVTTTISEVMVAKDSSPLAKPKSELDKKVESLVEAVAKIQSGSELTNEEFRKLYPEATKDGNLALLDGTAAKIEDPIKHLAGQVLAKEIADRIEIPKELEPVLKKRQARRAKKGKTDFTKDIEDKTDLQFTTVKKRKSRAKKAK